MLFQIAKRKWRKKFDQSQNTGKLELRILCGRITIFLRTAQSLISIYFVKFLNIADSTIPLMNKQTQLRIMLVVLKAIMESEVLHSDTNSYQCDGCTACLEMLKIYNIVRKSMNERIRKNVETKLHNFLLFLNPVEQRHVGGIPKKAKAIRPIRRIPISPHPSRISKGRSSVSKYTPTPQPMRILRYSLIDISASIA